MAMVVFYVVILALSYRGTLLAFLDGTLTDASGAAYPGWLLFFYFSAYHMFFPMVLWTILPVLEGSQIAAVGLCCGIACDFLAETKDLLLKHAREEEGASSSSYDAKHDDAAVLAALAEIQDRAEKRIHMFRQTSKILVTQIAVGAATSIVMIFLSLLPATYGDATKLSGISLTLVVGLTIFVAGLFTSSRHSARFEEASLALNDPRLMKSYVRLFGGRRQFFEWLRGTKLSATSLLGMKVHVSTLLRLDSVLVSLSGTAVFVAARVVQ